MKKKTMRIIDIAVTLLFCLFLTANELWPTLAPILPIIFFCVIVPCLVVELIMITFWGLDKPLEDNIQWVFLRLALVFGTTLIRKFLL